MAESPIEDRMAGPNSPFDENALELLDRINRSLNGAASYDQALWRGVHSVAPGLADFAVILTSAESGEQLKVAQGEPAREQEIRRLVLDVLPAVRRSALREQARNRDFRWIPHLTETSLRFLRDEPELPELLFSLGVNSLVVVPLRAEGKVLGGMALCRTRDLPFAATDLALIQVVARRVATAIQKARMYEQAADERSRSARLQEAVEKWVQVFDLAGWGAAIVDGSDFRIEAVNPAFARLHGYTGPEILAGRLFTDILPSGGAEELDGWNGRQAGPYESLHRRSDGSVFPVLTNVTPIQAERGSESFVVTVQDLTELKRTEERLRRAQRLEAVGRLAGGVAHEVNNMMTIILGFSDLLSRSQGLSPERQRDVEEIRKAATRAGKTTQQLLAFSRQQILQPTDLQLNDVVNDLKPALELLLPANIVLETSLSPIGAVVHADRAQLEQVLINLAFNGRDAMPNGGTLRFGTDSRWLDQDAGRRLIGIPIPPAQYALVSVVDTGHGMDPATVTQVFEPFFTTKPVGSGTGLGLATVYGIVKQSGGYVWVESTPGQGTTVTVCLPQAQSARIASKPPARQDGGVESCRGGTILVVEDEDGVRDLACRVLEQQGHRVLEARDGNEALKAMDQFGEGMDLILSDVIVPDIGTQKLEQELRRRRAEIPILYMSGYSREEMIARGLVPPGGAFLQKPFTAEELGQLVCRQLEPSAAR
jgi:two-component system, cell cycle sensor histidine kinase and response regulator CckA